MSAFSLPIPPGRLTTPLHRLTERSATDPEDRCQMSVVGRPSFADAATKPVQHARYRLVFAAPVSPCRRIGIPKVEAKADLYPHVARTQSLLQVCSGFRHLSSDNCLLNPAASARGLSPVTFSARDGLSRPVSCYAFFKGWLLLSQPPGCLGLPTSFPTEPRLGDLSRRSGLFPFRR